LVVIKESYARCLQDWLARPNSKGNHSSSISRTRSALPSHINSILEYNMKRPSKKDLWAREGQQGSEKDVRPQVWEQHQWLHDSKDLL
jgi:hypothetical protein